MSAEPSSRWSAPVSDRMVVAEVAARTRAGFRRDVADHIDRAVLVAVVAAGLFCPWGRGVWYLAFLVSFAGIAGAVVSGAALSTWIAERSSDRVQGPRTRPAFALRGARDTALAAWVAAALVAWAVSRSMAGLPIGLVWSAREAGGALRATVQTLAGVLVIDAWLYWKHRLLHTRWGFAFHRAHHGYRDPTSLAGFAVGPVEALLTFWPVVFVAIPEAKHWAPLYFGLVGGFVLLNFYLHCGVGIGLLERVLSLGFVNTSVFHNAHHANAEVNFGEAFTYWDRWCGTRRMNFPSGEMRQEDRK